MTQSICFEVTIPVFVLRKEFYNKAFLEKFLILA